MSIKNAVFTLFSCLAIVYVFTTAAVVAQETPAPETNSNQIQTVHLDSTALGRKMTYIAVLPAGFQTEQVKEQEQNKEQNTTPFLLFLHGRGRNERSLIDDPKGRQKLLQTDRVILFPHGDRSWWIDSPFHPADRYSSWLEEVLNDASKRFHLSQNPNDAAICGWSMGGYGAARFLETHPNQFGTIITLIALLDYPCPEENFPEGQRYPVHPNEWGNNPDLWPPLNPMTDAEAFRGKNIRLVTGRDSFDRTMNERFSALLTQKNIPHSLEIIPGDHSFELVVEQLDDILLYILVSMKK